MEYGEAWELQKDLFSERSQDEIIDTLLILQHPPTYTFGRRSLSVRSTDNLYETLNMSLRGRQSRPKQSEQLRDCFVGFQPPHNNKTGGFAVYHVNRGGGATYHGPGQIVGYPILRLHHYTTDYHFYLRMLEEVMIVTLDYFGIKSCRNPGYTGVWVDGEKIGSIGVRIIRGVTMHGFSLNVVNDLEPFESIIPCNIEGIRMTSMARKTQRIFDVEDVENSLVKNFSRVFGVKYE